MREPWALLKSEEALHSNEIKECLVNSPQTNILCQALVDKGLKLMPSVLVGDVDWKRQMVS